MTTLCSAVSRQSAEPLYGTAPAHAGTLYVSWDPAKWHPKNVLLTEGVPEALRLAVAKELERGRKFSVRFFVDAGAGDKLTLKWYPSALERRGIPLDDIGQAVADIISGIGEPIEGREFFICADAAHDNCCGKYGPALFAAAQKIVADKNLPLRIYRSSHIGGHKFAATGIVFPEGIVYGRMHTEKLSDLLGAIVAGRIYAPWYRGHAGVSVETQIVTAAAAVDPKCNDRHFVVENVSAQVSDRRQEIVADIRIDGELHKISVTAASLDFAVAEKCGLSSTKMLPRWVIEKTLLL